MHMQLAILCLFAVGVVTATGNDGGLSSVPCRQHLGVYHVTISYGPNVTSYAVITYHADGTATGIDSAADGNPSSTPPGLPYSSSSGVWKCDGPNKIEGAGIFFVYRVPGFPGALAEGKGDAKFDGKGGFSGTTSITLYDLASTKKKNRSKWVKIAGPSEFKGQGYKLYDI